MKHFNFTNTDRRSALARRIAQYTGTPLEVLDNGKHNREQRRRDKRQERRRVADQVRQFLSE